MHTYPCGYRQHCFVYFADFFAVCYFAFVWVGFVLVGAVFARFEYFALGFAPYFARRFSFSYGDGVCPDLVRPVRFAERGFALRFYFLPYLYLSTEFKKQPFCIFINLRLHILFINAFNLGKTFHDMRNISRLVGELSAKRFGC